VRGLRRHRTWLASRGIDNATRAVIDGRCQLVSFESGDSVWAASLRSGRVFLIAHGTDHDMQTNGKGVAYVRGGQVWYRSFVMSENGRHLQRGRERLVSSTASSAPGNGPSSAPALDDQGFYVAFQSDATDLCARRCDSWKNHPCRVNSRGHPQCFNRVTGDDLNGAQPDIFRRTLSRRAPTHDSMEKVSITGGSRPAISAAGENVVFAAPVGEPIYYMDPGYKEVRAPPVQLASWSFPRRRGWGDVKTVNRTGCYPNGCLDEVSDVSMTARGNYVAFSTTMPEWCAPWRPRGFPGDRDCEPYTGVFMRFMGWSHEGYRLG
jgi:hypothetical protein